jgi:glutamate N-acetyltransferase/amino-acid N-acetyltransferase
LQRVLAAGADDAGEWRLPLDADALARMRAALADAGAAVDEAFLSSAFAWMRKAAADGNDGVVSLIQTVLQLYAGAALTASPSDDPSDAALNSVLGAPEPEWGAALAGVRAGVGAAAFDAALARVCAELAEDVVRNGEGVQHVMRVAVRGAPSAALARAVGKAVVNSPLFKCAVGGNDPNVGRLVAAVGKCVGALPGAPLDVSRVAMRMGGIDIFARGAFTLSPDTERALVAHMRAAQLWESAPVLAPGAAGAPAPAGRAGTAYAAQDVSYVAPIAYPPHERSVEIEIDLGLGEHAATALGSDLTHEYVTENADYRS